MDWGSLVKRDELLFNGLTLGFQKANKKKNNMKTIAII